MYGPTNLMRDRAKVLDEVADDYSARLLEDAADEIDRLRAALAHATACCSAFQSGGQFNHLSRLGEPIFDAVPRLVAQLSN